jgi:hypothetical protein
MAPKGIFPSLCLAFPRAKASKASHCRQWNRKFFDYHLIEGATKTVTDFNFQQNLLF